MSVDTAFTLCPMPVTVQYSLVSEKTVPGRKAHLRVTEQIGLQIRLILANVSIESRIASKPCGESIDGRYLMIDMLEA